MDQVAPAAYNPHLQRVLKSFQCAAEASLSGPSRFMAVWTNQQDPATTDPSVRSITETDEIRKAMISSSMIKKTVTVPSDKLSGSVGENSNTFYPAAGYPVAPVAHLGPVFLPMDTTHSEKAETVLEGETISCFVVGGEKRLCLPQILNTVLQDFSLQQINTICDDLHIFCSRCTIQQLDLLKMTGVLPPSAPSCGLITKTDAERLCNALLHSSPERSRESPSANSFKVYHECFGKCKGVFCPELYTSAKARCIECWDCHGMFPPQKFVCHSHKARENRTCHWGFDSANWRAYLLLAKDQDCRDLMQRALDDMKDKFDVTAHKKKRGGSSERSEEEAKRARFEQNGLKGYEGSAALLREYQRGLSAFRPWSPSLETLIKEGKIPAPGSRDGFFPNYLQQGPPVLLNPERVVPFNDTKRYDRHFAPNVSLAPQAPGKEDDKQSIDRFPEFTNSTKIDLKLLSSTSSYSMSSTSTLSSPSPVKVERHPDLDLSSSDESSFRSESAVPSTPRDEHRSIADVTVPVESDLTTDRNLMLGLVRRALEVCAETNPEDQEVILEQIAEVWARQEDRITALVQSRKHLLQEMEMLRVSKHERLQEMSESRLTLRHEVERLQCQLDAKSREALIGRQKLQKELDMIKMSRNPEISKIKNKYKGQIEVLKGRLEHYQCLNNSMATEIDCLNKRLSKLGHDVSGLSSIQQTAAPGTKDCCSKAIKEEISEAYSGDKMEEPIECSENGYHDHHSDDDDIEVMEESRTELMDDT